MEPSFLNCQSRVSLWIATWVSRNTGAGVALGVIGVGARQVTDEMMLAASKALSGCVTSEELKDGSILPRIKRLR